MPVVVVAAAAVTVAAPTSPRVLYYHWVCVLRLRRHVNYLLPDVGVQLYLLLGQLRDAVRLQPRCNLATATAIALAAAAPRVVAAAAAPAIALAAAAILILHMRHRLRCPQR